MRKEKKGEKVLEVLYLLDKYGVSDAFYQALSMKNAIAFQEQAKLKLLDGNSTKQWNYLVSQRLMGLIGTLKRQFERRY